MSAMRGGLVLASVLLLAPGAVLGQERSLEPGAPALAVQRYALGIDHYRARRFDHAAEEFEAALLVFPASAKLAYNLGRCYERLGRPSAAIEQYRRYLKRTPGAPDRDSVQRLLSALEKRVPELVLNTTPAGASVTIDAGEAPIQGRTPLRHRVPVGERLVRFSLTGYADAVRTVELEPGDSKVLHVELEPASSTAWVGWSLVGVGLAAGATGAVFLNLAATDADEADQLGPRPSEVEERADLEDAFEAHRTVGWVGVGLGAAAVSTGLALLLWPEDAPLTVSTRGRGLRVEGSF